MSIFNLVLGLVGVGFLALSGLFFRAMWLLGERNERLALVVEDLRKRVGCLNRD